MTYASSVDAVKQLSAKTENLFKELQQELDNKTLDSKSALNKLKKLSENVGEVTGAFLFSLCSSTAPEEDDSFQVLQDVQTWVKDTAIRLTKLNVQEQGILPPYPPRK